MHTLRLLAIPVLSAAVGAQQFEFYPGARYDPEVPTLEAVVGHAWGEDVSSHAEIERYLFALAEASPRVRVFEYARSWEDRPLYYLVVANAENMSRLDGIREDMQNLAEPRDLGPADEQRLVDTLPAVVWLAYSVHGDEISGSDAALLTAYHLVAAQEDELAGEVLGNAVVIIDPLQNPDGRDRFVFNFRQTRGPWPDPEPDAAEHNQPWPGGRTNHYLFDMNRDWFALSQPETRGRVREFLKWWPVVYVDLHEMGSNATYYFAPPADPINPEITAPQREWLTRYGRNNARWFDRFGFDYFTRESYDAFYPGYGEGWPMFHGAIGMTYEQASVRGLVVRRDDDSVLHYRDSVRHHFIASLATAETAARNRREVLQAFVDYRKNAVEEGRGRQIVEYVFPWTGDRGRLLRLVGLLAEQGIEVLRATSELRTQGAVSYFGGEVGTRTFPEGSFLVSLAQPAKHLAASLLDRHQDLDEEWLAEQKEKREKRKRNEFYDLTAWSLPLLFDVECWAIRQPCRGGREIVSPEALPGLEVPPVEEATVAWLVEWGTNGAARLLAQLLRKEVKVRCADKPFTIDGVSYPAGSLVIKAVGNGEGTRELLAGLAPECGVEVRAVDSSWVEEGIHFGSNNMQHLEQPKVAMAWDRPARGYSAGWARYLLEQRYGQPVTLIRARQIPRADLDRFNVLVLPEGGYDETLGKSGAERIVDWVRRGGTLVTLGRATRWLTGKDVGLLAVEPEDRKVPGAAKPEDGDAVAKPGEGEPGQEPEEKEGTKPPKGEKEPEPFDYEKAIQPDVEPPFSTPGAIVRARTDPEHWLAFGYDGDANVLHDSSAIYTPIKLDKGTNVVVYAPRDELLLSGFSWDSTLDQLAQKAYLVHQPHGRGHVVAFAEDPNLRAFADGLNLLFLNAILFGPGH